MDQDVQE
jgi:hypothetical protein